MQTVQILERRRHMATEFTFILSVQAGEESRARRALIRAHGEVQSLESELSEFKSNSPVSLLNRAAAGEGVPFTASSLELLQLSEKIYHFTEGSFDPWLKSPPKNFDLGPRFKVDGNRVAKLHTAGHLGFGAIGKGFALDRVAMQLELEGFRDYLLSAGGSSLIFSGFARRGEPWSWAWSWGKDADGDRVGIPLLHLNGQRMAVGVSGTEEQGNHLLFPMSASGPESRSALVAHPSAAMADALSTALYVGGWKNSLSRFQKAVLPLPGCARIDLDGAPEWNGVFRHLWGDLAAPVESIQAAPEAQRRAFAIAVGTALLGETLSRAEDAAKETGEESVSLDEAVSGKPPVSTFNPYSFDRNPAWMIPAIAMSFYVLWHLRGKKTKNRKSKILAVAHSGSKKLQKT